MGIVTKRLYEELRESWVQMRPAYEERTKAVSDAESDLDRARRAAKGPPIDYAQGVAQAMQALDYAKSDLRRCVEALNEEYEKDFRDYAFDDE